jgi:hypothetical protein
MVWRPHAFSDMEIEARMNVLAPASPLPQAPILTPRRRPSDEEFAVMADTVFLQDGS